MLGFLGVGHLANAMIQGLLRSGMDPTTLLLSPRGQAREMARSHGISLAADNHDLVRRAEIVILAVRPSDAPAVVAGLPWDDGQMVVSVCAGVPLLRLDVAPARAVRAMPLMAARMNASPTVCFPAPPEVVSLLSRIGPVIPLASEQDFDVATVSAAVYGWVQALIGRTIDWSVGKGLDPDAMRALVAHTFVAAGRMVAERPEPMRGLLEELVTPGGITELGLKVLAARGQPEIWDEACEAVLARLTRPTRT